jgi:aminoglycoside 3-N-acetyltransferase
MEIDRIVTGSRIADDLRALGLTAGQCVMLHESVRAIGWVVGGPEVVLTSVLDVLGPDGSLMKLVGSEDGTYEVDDLPEAAKRAYLDERPAYQPERTRACREWGILCEYLRTLPGARRSAHPESSFAAIGARAEWLLEPHPLRHGYGPGSPLARLIEAEGKVLLLGAPLEAVTLLHHAEYTAALPHKRSVRYRAPVLVDGGRHWVELEELDSSRGIVAWPGTDYFELIVRAFLAAGLARSGRVGHAESHLLDARTLHDFGVAWMERELRPFAVP